jgi:CheY-like chemotaxis protein
VDVCASRLSVLVIRDQLSNCHSSVTSSWGADVVVSVITVGPGKEPLLPEHFDAVVVDLSAEARNRTDELALTRWLRQDPRIRALPIIVVSDFSNDEDHERFERAGADRLLPKESPAEVLACEVRRTIAARRRRSFRP